HRCRDDLHDFLGHHSHIWLVATVIAEAIETKAVVQITEKNDVVLQSDIGAPSGATSATASAATARHGTTSATATRPQAAATATAAAAGELLPASSTMGRSRACRTMRGSRLCALS